MKRAIKMSLMGLLILGLFTACEKPNGNEDGCGETATKNYVEKAFGMNLEMVYVEGGTFDMGAVVEQEDEYENNEKPVRSIYLDSYYIGKYEVTQSQWKKVMGTTLEEQRARSNHDNGIYGEGFDYPMYYVSWYEAKAFCDSLSKQTGKKYILPTEAQWEYAARGGVHKEKLKYAGSNNLEEVAWYCENSQDLGWEHPDFGVHLIGTKKANKLRVYDMTGNVHEWCLDWYGKYDKMDIVNPQGPVTGECRVLRGGAWASDAEYCRVAIRPNMEPSYSNLDLGFRVVMIP